MIVRIFIIISFLIFLNGCATTAVLKEMKTHSENIEITISSDQTKVLWKSDPDYSGSIDINPIEGCPTRKVFIPNKIYTEKQPVVTPSRELQLRYNRAHFKKFNDEFIARLNICDLYLIEGPVCDPVKCHEAVSLDLINSKGDTESSTRLSPREGIPVEYWPMLTLGVTGDIIIIGGLAYLTMEYYQVIALSALVSASMGEFDRPAADHNQ